jgi:hypothetical protein
MKETKRKELKSEIRRKNARIVSMSKDRKNVSGRSLSIYPFVVNLSFSLTFYIEAPH